MPPTIRDGYHEGTISAVDNIGANGGYFSQKTSDNAPPINGTPVAPETASYAMKSIGDPQPPPLEPFSDTAFMDMGIPEPTNTYTAPPIPMTPIDTKCASSNDPIDDVLELGIMDRVDGNNLESRLQEPPIRTVSPVKAYFVRKAVQHGLRSSDRGEVQTLNEEIKREERAIVENEKVLHHNGGLDAAVAQIKGGTGKSTTSIYTAGAMREVTNQNVVLLDADPRGLLGLQMGVDEGYMLTIWELAEAFIKARDKAQEQGQREPGLKELTAITSRLTNNGSHGVTIVSPDDRYADEDIQEKQRADLAIVMNILKLMPYRFYDLGRDLRGPIPEAVLNEADVFVFPALPFTNITLVQLQKTMSKLRSMDDGRFADRVDNGVVVLHGLKNSEEDSGLGPINPEELDSGNLRIRYGKYLTTLDKDGETAIGDNFKGTVIGIPYVKRIAEYKSAEPINLSDLQPITGFLGRLRNARDRTAYLAYLRLLNAITSQGVRQVAENIHYPAQAS